MLFVRWVGLGWVGLGVRNEDMKGVEGDEKMYNICE